VTARLHLPPHPAFEPLRPVLSEGLARVAAGLHAAPFATLLNPLMRQVLQRGFEEATAHEGTVWLLDAAGEHLTPAYNTGPRAAEMVGRFALPLNVGLISMVFASEQPFLENEVWKNTQQSKHLDALLQVQTSAMIAVPFGFLQGCRGVVSCVQLSRPGVPEPEPPGFRPEHLASVQRATALLSQLVEYHLLSRLVGWTCE